METVTATELHDRTSELTEQAMSDPERPIVVEKHGKPAIVLVDARFFEGLLETLDILSDPQAVDAIRRSLEDERAGRLIPHAQAMKELGLDDKRPAAKKTRRRRVDARRARVSARNR